MDIVLDRLDISPIVYICGVAKGPDSERKHRNLHLPLLYERGAMATLSTHNGYEVTAMNAAQLEIPPVPDGWNGLPLRHTRCKNFRFAHSWFGSATR